MAILDNVKIILNIPDTSQDTLLNLYISKVTIFVKSYCNVVELTTDLESAVEDIVILRYRNKGIENLKSGSEGSVSFNIADLPQDIVIILKSNRKIRIL